MEGVRVGGIQSCNTRTLKYRYRIGNGLWTVFVACTIAKPLRITSDFFTIQGNKSCVCESFFRDRKKRWLRKLRCDCQRINKTRLRQMGFCIGAVQNTKDRARGARDGMQCFLCVRHPKVTSLAG